MRVSRLAFLLPLALSAGVASAQDQGAVAVNMGRGLGSGMSVGWTFRDNWTLQPTLGLGYSSQGGFQAALGGTVLRSFGWGHRVYGYAGAGVYYGSANTGYSQTTGGLAPRSGTVNGGTVPNNTVSSSNYYSTSSLGYLTAPAGLRAKVYDNFELFAEAAYQRTLSGEFGANQAGQFSGNANRRFGATFGLTMRLN
jgi:hypothetical protein